MSSDPILLIPLESHFTPGVRLGNSATRELYELEKRLGTGTTGSVWEARRLGLPSFPEVPAPKASSVAIKIFHRTVTDVQNAVHMLKREVGALIRLSYPGIVALLDCGYDPKAKRLYIVTNLIPDAQSIVHYCNESRQNVRERLQHFLHVCKAVRYAHQNEIVHLDIKPSNVQMSITADEPTPILIDFSLARIKDSLTTNTQFGVTYSGQSGTPIYMSPQQAGMPGEVGYQSDVYSLGVLLFELMTGTTPFQCYISDRNDRVVSLQDDQSVPSVSEMYTAVESAFHPTLGRKDSNSMSMLLDTIPSELRTILKKSLATHLNNRYRWVTELINDIEAYLAHRPIAGHSDAISYKLRKYVRRNVIMISGVVCTFAFVAGTAWHYRREAYMQRQIQMEEAKRFAESSHENRIFDGLLKDVGYTMAGHTRSPQLRGLLDSTQLRIASEFATDITAQTEARLRLGTVYEYLGLFDRFAEIASNNVFLSRKTTNVFLIARARAQLGQAFSDQGKLGASEEMLTNALAVQETLLPSKLLSRVYAVVGSLNTSQLRSACSEWTNNLQEIAQIDVDVGDVWDDQHRLHEACKAFEHAISIYKILGPDYDADLATAKDDLGFALMELRDPGGAQIQFAEALAIRTNNFGQVHREVANSLNDMAVLCRLLGPTRWEEAERLQRMALGMQLASLAADHPVVAISYDNLGNIYYYRHLYKQAQEYYEKAFSIRMDVLGPQYRETATSFYELVRCLRKQDEYARAGETARTFFEQQLPNATIESRVRYTDIAAFYILTLIDNREYDKAAVLANRMLEQRELACSGTWRCYSMRSLLGMALAGNGQLARARDNLLPAFEFFRNNWRQVPADGLSRLKDTGRGLTDCYVRLGQMEEAKAVAKEITGLQVGYPEWEADTREGGL